MTDWKPTACILCECNCGIEVQVEQPESGAPRLVKIRGDKRHPASQGYACEKPHRLDYYQRGRDRLLRPLKRSESGSFEEVTWAVAIGELTERLAKIRDEHGGSTIFYYGGGGQGNHLPGAYATATRHALGSRYRSSALAQEKTGEFWIANRMLGSATRADFEHCDVAVFVGKNPWHSHSIQRARVVLKEIAGDPGRTLIVIDPRETETAKLADIHLRVRPGQDAYLMTALVALLIRMDAIDRAFVESCTDGLDDVMKVFADVDVAAYCARAGVAQAQVEKAAASIARAERLATMEDLGVQMNRHSTLVSYLHRLVWLLTGNFGKRGTAYIPTTLVNFTGGASKRKSPVVGAPIISGLIPCNRIADEILADHPERYRAMLIEAANPLHSLADSKKMREAMAALDCSAVIDVAMTESARAAHFVLPSANQFEKAEATFFNFEFPDNYFQLRPRLFSPPKVQGDEGPLPEAEIHARIVEALGMLPNDVVEQLREAAKAGYITYAQAFMGLVLGNPKLAGLAAVILYRTLGPSLPDDRREAAVLFGLAFRFAMERSDVVAKAGFGDNPMEGAVAMFEAMLSSPSGMIFAKSDWPDVRERVEKEHGRIQLALADMLDEVRQLDVEPAAPPTGFPFILSAGERRSFTANTIIRDPSWRRKDAEGALRMSPTDAAELGIGSGDRVRLVTSRDAMVVSVDVSDTMQQGHISLPNGLGLTASAEHDDGELGGVAPNELTDVEARDKFVGTPWHKCVPARLERISPS